MNYFSAQGNKQIIYPENAAYPPDDIYPENAAYPSDDDNAITPDDIIPAVGTTKQRKHKKTRKIVPEENRCAGICKTGLRCQKARLQESYYCHIHKPKMRYTAKVTPYPLITSNNKSKSSCIGNGCRIMGGRKTRKN